MDAFDSRKDILRSTTSDRIILSTNRIYALKLYTLALVAALAISVIFPSISHVTPNIGKIQRCSIKNLRKDTSFLQNVKPISKQEFIHRRDRLAEVLFTNDIDAFVLEPGYTFQYYGNVSQIDWEPWEPEERPFLMVIQPVIDVETEVVTAHTSFLAPHFEVERVRMLNIPADEDLEIVPWEEHWNPYRTLRENTFRDKDSVRIMVDEEMRDYIVRGLDENEFNTVGLSNAVAAVRQIKSPAEIEILRAVNTGTVAAVRKMRPCLVPGLNENQVMDILNNALTSIGFSPFFDIVLFDENAASPHGGTTGIKVLDHDTMVLIDVGAHYLGYASDITRSFFIDPPYHSVILSALTTTLTHISHLIRKAFKSDMTHLPISIEDVHKQKLHVWSVVNEAQTASIAMFQPNNSAASVDIAARNVIEKAGYGKDFTHRVGHGIGIKAHESPYLNKGNTEAKLLPGMTFTSEPGIYLQDLFGVRLEDVFLVKAHDSNGQAVEAECLSGTRAKGPYEP